MKPKNTEENCERLAREVVDSWDMDTLVSFAIEQLQMNYMLNVDEFEDDWPEFMEIGD